MCRSANEKLAGAVAGLQEQLSKSEVKHQSMACDLVYQVSRYLQLGADLVVLRGNDLETHLNEHARSVSAQSAERLAKLEEENLRLQAEVHRYRALGTQSVKMST